MIKNSIRDFSFSKPFKALLLLSLLVISIAGVELWTQVNAEHSTITKSLSAGGNIVSLRDITNITNQTAILTIDAPKIRAGEDITINVNDDAANLDPTSIDEVIATATSNTSNGVMATAVLSEQEINSGTFSGIITLSSDTTTGNELQFNRFDKLDVIYDQKDFQESARFQAQITAAGPGTVELTDYFIDTKTKLDTACPFVPVTHAVDVNVIGTTASNIIVEMSFANALGKDVLVRPDLLDIGYRDSSAGTSFTSLGGTLDFAAKTITSVSQPPSVNGQYILGNAGVGCVGGGGGGLVRPSLVVNALAGVSSFSGDADFSAPAMTLDKVSQTTRIDIPLEIEQMILNHDSKSPIESMSPNLFEEFDFPLEINGKGFALTGYENTLVTESLGVGEKVAMKFVIYDTKIQHFSLYMNLRDGKDKIPDSDTQILYNDGNPIQIIDANNFLENVSVTIFEVEDSPKNEVLVELVFLKPMEQSDLIVRTWDPLLHSVDTIILDAIEVVPKIEEESSAPTFEEPVIEEISSQSIPKWVKNNAGWWSAQQIADSDFVSGIEYLIKNEIINVPGVEVTAGSASTEIPDWIKNNAGWWAESLITDVDFIEAMQWLIGNGVIQI